MQRVLPLIDPLCITVCKEEIVFAYLLAFSFSDIALTGMCWEHVGTAVPTMMFVKL